MAIHVESATLSTSHAGAGEAMLWWQVVKTVTGADGAGERQTHIFPPDTLEWRAAEYGIEHTDVETLLRVVLYEPHLQQLDTPDHMHPLTLHNAPSIADARAFHLQRVADAAAHQPMTVAAHPSLSGRDVLHEVRTTSPLHPSVIQAKAALVARTRNAAQARRRENAGRSHHTQLPEAERLSLLLAQTNRHQKRLGALDG